MLALAFAVLLNTPIATVTHPPINEMSGIVASTRRAGVLWVHNDSGDSARIFPIKEDGSIVLPTGYSGPNPYPGITIGNATNVDWEDITYDGRNLYISDMGNNDNNRTNLGIYKVQEPNPASPGNPIGRFVPVRYPDQTEFPPPTDRTFDCEAIFYYNYKVYFLTKHRNGILPVGNTKLYRLNSTDAIGQQTLQLLDHREGLKGWVTAADVSPDGTKLAVLCSAPLARLWIFPLNQPNDKLLSGTPQEIVLTSVQQAEAVCFTNNNTVLITNEQRDIFKVTF